jgi:AraC-like DNA-binding protein
MAMAERASRLEFDIREMAVGAPPTRSHRHEHFRIFVALEGCTRQAIGGAVRTVQPGSLGFVLPYRAHRAASAEGGRFIVINFSQRFLRPDLDVDPLDLDDMPVSRMPELAPFLYQEHLDFALSGADWDAVQALLRQMLDENAARRFGSHEILRGMLLQLIGLTCRRYEADLLRLAGEKTRSAAHRDALQRVSRYIRDNLTRDPNLTQAAATAFLSPNHLAHLLKHEVGKTFTDLVTERRMERAQQLLANTPMRIAEVAHACGFPDEGYFTRRFRQWFGMTPHEYRQSVSVGVSGTA